MASDWAKLEKETRKRMQARGLKVGDLITAYTPGIHKITKIGNWKEGASTYLITYVQVLDSKFNKPKSKPRSKVEKSCDASYCKLVDKSYLESIRGSHASQIENLELELALAYPAEGMNETDND